MSSSEQEKVPTDTTSDNPAHVPSQGEKEKPSKSRKPARKPVSCKFFFTDSGCKLGENCRFSHSADTPEVSNKKPNPRKRTQKKKKEIIPTSTSVDPVQQNTSSSTSQVTRKTDHESHTPNEQALKPKEQSDTITSNIPQLTARQTELNQIQRRFKDSFKFEPTSTEVAPSFRIKLVPSDPEFPFELESLQLKISLPEKYFNTEENLKDGVPQFEVLNEEIPEPLKKSVIEFLKKDSERLLISPPAFLRARARSQKGTIQILRPVLNKLDRELADLLIEKPVIAPPLPKPIPAPRAPAASGTTIKFVRNNAPKPQNAQPDERVTDDLQDLFSKSVMISNRGSEDELAISNVTEELPLYQPPKTEEKPDAQSEENPENKENRHKNSGNAGCYEIKVTDLRMEGVALVECVLLSLSMKCVKCTTATKTLCTVDLDLVPGKEVSNICTNGKCGGLQVTVKFQPGMLHQNSDVLGMIAVHPPYIFQPYDLLPSTYRLTCGSCPVPDDDQDPSVHNGITARRLAASRTFTQRCHLCHENNIFAIETARFTSVAEDARHTLKLSDTAKVGLKKKKKKELEELGLVPGQHLPDKGACKHYKKSYRWLTFPCCGKSFPCDQCHDDKSDHETKFANRMICGYCSTSQSFHPSRPCNSCGRTLVSSSAASGGHWEGGKGTRNQVRMSRKDAQKYRGLGKTVSKKDERVGQKK